MREIECFFDCSSPWTFLAFDSLLALKAETGCSIRWRPILIGGVFNAVNDSVYRFRENPIPPKDAYIGKDLADWARHQNLKILWRPSIFPINSARAMRACIYADEENLLEPFAGRMFELYWSQDRDIQTDETLRDAAEFAGLDAGQTLVASTAPRYKDALRANTNELVERGGFGSPTIFVGGDDMYFGNDRMPLIRTALFA